jgi:hypothetical protein
MTHFQWKDPLSVDLLRREELSELCQFIYAKFGKDTYCPIWYIVAFKRTKVITQITIFIGEHKHPGHVLSVTIYHKIDSLEDLFDCGG